MTLRIVFKNRLRSVDRFTEVTLIHLTKDLLTLQQNEKDGYAFSLKSISRLHIEMEE